MPALERVRATAAQIRMHRTFGIARRRHRMPRQRYPKSIEFEYAQALLALVDRARSAFYRLLAELSRLLELAAARRRMDDVTGGDGDEMRRLIEEAREKLRAAITPAQLEAIAQRFADRTQRYQLEQLQRQVRAALGADIFIADKKLPALIDHFVAENVALIRAIPEDVASGIEKLATRALSSGTLHADLADQIENRFGVAESRARLIARDQVGKLYGQVNASRQQQLGVTSFVWRTMHDERVRPEHQALDGSTFKYDDPPDEGLPGEPINCRCYADPVFDDILDDADADAMRVD